ncbi:N-acetylgalactosamine-6-O-sulfatase [Durusdinium trenchii]|uniref:N-acetylgalactosamine-6-O-sulfatase n=1 Tax=Durusdinium trenchii TaxID=1381693 RepID=A0ABP0LEG0_9DINO
MTTTIRHYPQALACIATLVGAIAVGHVCRAEGRPNVVIVLADDLGYGDLRAYGGEIPTPHLDRLASDGIRFTDFHSSGNVCSPTRAGLLTGRYQHRAGISGVVYADAKNPTHFAGLQSTEITLPELLRDHGYETALFGKWHLGYYPQYNPVNHGFRDFRGYISGNVDYHTHLDNQLRDDWWHGRQLKPEPGYSTHLIAKYADEFIRARGSSCARSQSSTPNRRRSVREIYRDMLVELDESVGRKGTDWEGGHRVPAIAWWPGKCMPAVSSEIVSSLDLMPTVLDVTGIAPPSDRELDGQSLKAHILEGEPLGNRELYWDHAVRSGKWKLVTEEEAAELYDLEADLSETTDLTQRHSEVAQALQEKLCEWEAEVKRHATQLVRESRSVSTQRDSNQPPFSRDVTMRCVSVLLGCMLTSSLAQAAETQAEVHVPNIVYVLADDLGYGDVSCFNENAAWRTPHIDKLASQGMRFTDAHSGSSVCSPTRYGILTGRYAWRTHSKNGVLSGVSPPPISPERLTVARLLQQIGYHTACIGKWHLGWNWATRDDEQGGGVDFSGPVQNGPGAVGFDYYYCLAASLDMPPYVYVEDNRVTSLPNRTTVNKGMGFWRQGDTGADFEHEDVLANFTKRSVAYIQERAVLKSPFFLYLAIPSPHTPILPTREFLGKSGTNANGDFVLQTDDAVGQIVRAIEEAGIAQQTLLIVTSDNGCAPLADYKELAKFGHDPSAEFRGHKADIFEGGHRVPFVIRWPQRVSPATSCEATICLTDLMRTCADVLGVTLSDNAAGDSVSFLPAIKQPELKEPLRASVVHHSINGSFAIRQGKWKLNLCPGSGGWSDPSDAKARRMGLPLVQLYDLEQDSAETSNLARKFPEIVDELAEKLLKDIERGSSTPGERRKNDGDTPFLPEGYPKPSESAFDLNTRQWTDGY